MYDSLLRFRERKELIERARKLAERQGTSLASILRKFLREWIRVQEKRYR